MAEGAIPPPAGVTAPAGTGGRTQRLTELESALLTLLRRRGVPAQVHVRHRGSVVADVSYRCQPDHLFWTFSATKAFASVAIWRLIERGLVELDAPVATYWPAFAANGKDLVTVRHVLQHRSGMATGNAPTLGRGMLRDAAVMPFWRASAGRYARARLTRAPGEHPAYQFLAYGYILGEIVQRVADLPYPEVLARDIFEPLGLADTSLGLSRPEAARLVPVRAGGRGGWLVNAGINNPITRGAAAPSAGLTTTARDLATFYAALARDYAGDQPALLLAPETLHAATHPSSSGEVDAVINEPIRWSHGFQLGGPRVTGFSPMGRTSSPRAFGHNGSHACIGWADPEAQIGFAHLTNRSGLSREDAVHQAAVADEVLAAVRSAV